MVQRLGSLVMALLVGCGAPEPRADGGLSADAGREDAGRDAGRPGLPVPTPSALPVGAADVLRLGPGIQLDVASAFSLAVDGTVTLVFDSFDRDFSFGGLQITSSLDGRAFQVPRPLAMTEHPYEASPSFVRGTLYFAGANNLTSAPVLYRAAVVGAAAPLAPVAGVDSLLSWPKLYAWGDRVAIAFRDGASRPMFAWGEDASSIGPAVLVGPDSGGALATLGVFDGGSLAYAYQHPVDAEPMVSFVRRSTDGVAWSDPVRVTDASSNVHDTTLVPRADGGLDLYYIYPAGSRGFVLFRRALMPDGRMGSEERVTADDVGEPSKPEGVRLGNGRVLVAFADIAARAATGEPSRQEIALVSLPSDAAAP